MNACLALLVAGHSWCMSAVRFELQAEFGREPSAGAVRSKQHVTLDMKKLWEFPLGWNEGVQL